MGLGGERNAYRMKWICFICAFLSIAGVNPREIVGIRYEDFFAFLKIIIPIAYVALLYVNKENKVCFWNVLFVSMACSFLFIPIENDDVLTMLSFISILVFVKQGVMLWRKESVEKKKQD